MFSSELSKDARSFVSWLPADVRSIVDGMIRPTGGRAVTRAQVMRSLKDGAPYLDPLPDEASDDGQKSPRGTFGKMLTAMVPGKKSRSRSPSPSRWPTARTYIEVSSLTDQTDAVGECVAAVLARNTVLSCAV